MASLFFLSKFNNLHTNNLESGIIALSKEPKENH